MILEICIYTSLWRDGVSNSHIIMMRIPKKVSIDLLLILNCKTILAIWSTYMCYQFSNGFVNRDWFSLGWCVHV